ncbi:MAG: hypothetical protein FWD60_10815 [Candidatus Azobacteroides sp.]|nr:hypothetical protein [Candidatus Azobacteroides sp.]
MATTKKVTKVSSGENTRPKETFVPTAEAKAQAGKFRMYGILLWILAIVAEIGAMVILFKKDPEIDLTTGNRIMLIAILLVDLALLIVGSSFWKKANRFDPASKQNVLKFFFQNQLGVVVAVIAFLPVVILAIIKKEYLVAAIAALFMVGGGAASADYNPPSKEEYAKQSEYVKELTGVDHVYWTKSGTKYHLYDDCQYLKSDRTTEIFEGGSVADAYAKNHKIKPDISSLCSACEKRAAKEKGWTDEQLQQAKDNALNSVQNAVQP